MRHMLAAMIALTLTLAACDGDDAPHTTPAPTATFTHGVAAGDVTSTSAVLWTRAEGGETVVAEITSASGQLLRLQAQTSAERDYTVRLPVTGLTPATAHEYRFRAGGGVSDTGMFTTAPDDAASAPVRFVFAGDSDGTRDASGTGGTPGVPAHGEFEVLRAAAAEDPAFFLYLGDTIYADRGTPATTLDQYRAKYAANREYHALKSILEQTSVIAMWDDHEVTDNFAGTTVDPAMFQAARQAFSEWWPMAAIGDDAAWYRSLRWGKHVELIVLDARSYRLDSVSTACNNDPLPAGALPGAPETLRGVREIAGLPSTLASDCVEALAPGSPKHTMLGAGQKQFLFDQLRSSDATWKIVATSVPMQALLFSPYDRWEGYPAERREVLEFIRDNGIKNVVFVSTDLHANIFGPVRIDATDQSTAVAYEAIAGPIAAETLEQDIVNVLGEGGAGLLGPFLTGIVGVECAQLDAFAYGVVEASASSLTVTAKDAAGSVLCEKRLEAQ